MDFSDYPVVGRWGGSVVDWASREVDNPEMDFKQQGFWLGAVGLARYLNCRLMTVLPFSFKAWQHLASIDGNYVIKTVVCRSFLFN